MSTLAMTVVLQAALLAAPADTYSGAFGRSTDSGRPLVVMLTADWCPGCVKMKNSILPEVEKAGGLKDVEFAYVDVDQNRELAAKLARGASIPQLVRFNKTPTGWQVNHLVGAQSPTKVNDFINAGVQLP